MLRRLASLALALGLLVPLFLQTAGAADARRPMAVHHGAAGASAGLVIGYKHWGPLFRGMSAAKAQKTGMVSKKPDMCAPGYLMTPKYQDRGFAWWSGSMPNVHVQLLIVTGRADHTDKGAHVGTTLSRLRKTYAHLSKLTSGATVFHQVKSSRDIWAVWLRTKKGTIVFQFPYGKRPTGSSKVERIVVSKKPTIWYGC